MGHVDSPYLKGPENSQGVIVNQAANESRPRPMCQWEEHVFMRTKDHHTQLKDFEGLSGDASESEDEHARMKGD